MQNRAYVQHVLVALMTLSAPAVSRSLPAQVVGDSPLAVVPLLGISDRVRVSVGGIKIVGEVASATGEGFEFLQGGIRRSFAFSEIDDLERSNGVRSYATWGLLPGFIGGILAKSTIDGCVNDGELHCLDAREVLLWGGGGCLLGAVAGFLIKLEAWESVLPDGHSVGVTPTFAPQPGRGGRLALALRGRIEF